MYWVILVLVYAVASLVSRYTDCSWGRLVLVAVLGSILVSALEDVGIVCNIAQAYMFGVGVGLLALGWAAKWKQ